MKTPPAPLFHASILALALSGCQVVQHEKGNILEPEMVSQIKPGVTSQAMVQELLGSPTTVNTFRGNRWIYIQDRRFEGNRAVNRVEITFDRNGVVSRVDRNFDDQLLDPQTLTPDAGSRSARIWRTFQREETEQEVGVKEGLGRVGSLPPPSRASQEQDEAAKRLNWVDRYVLFRKPQAETAKGPRPDSRFAPGEEGWWRRIWSEDPSQPVRQLAPGEHDPLEKSYDTTLPAFATERAIQGERAGTAESRPSASERPWWRFWSRD